jgi:hypothetical protein
VIGFDGRVRPATRVDDRTYGRAPRLSADLGGDGELSMTGSAFLGVGLSSGCARSGDQGAWRHLDDALAKKVAGNAAARIGGAVGRALPFGAQPSPARSSVGSGAGCRDAGVLLCAVRVYVIRLFENVASGALQL